MKTSFLPVLLALASLSVPVFGNPIIGSTYTITEQNEHLTTDFGATVGGVKDDWILSDLPGLATGREYTPEPSGETGVNVAYSYDDGASIVVRSDVSVTGSELIPLVIVVDDVVHPVQLLDIRNVPDASTTIALLGISFLGLAGFARLRQSEAV